MSDKPIHAEIVTADQIKVGDRIAYRGYKGVVHEWRPERDTENKILFYDCGIEKAWTSVFPWEFIARILPEPVNSCRNA